MNLSTHYMGLPLRNPVVVSACPLSEDIDNILQMEDAGAGAVVLFSLFEEQIRRENALHDAVQQVTTNTFAEALDYFPDLDEYHVGSARYLELIQEAKSRTDLPIIASLNGTTPEGWIEYARQMEEAGADGLEINVFFIPVDPNLTAHEVESRYEEIVKLIKSQVSIPVAIKINPYFSSMSNMANKLVDAGADALVLFNRFYQPDFDIMRLQVLSNLEYSSANEIRLPLLWIAALYGRVGCSMAATTGVQSAEEVIKYLLAGADVAMCASALYKHGIGYLATIIAEMTDWMETMQFTNIEAFRGALSQRNVSDPTAYERANYIRILEGMK